MYFVKCSNSILFVHGGEKYIKCKITGDICCFQRYCLEKKNFELAPSANNCKYNPKNINTK